MLNTLKAIKEILLTKNIYEGGIAFLGDKNADRLDKVYIESRYITKNNEILFITGESPFYVRELITGKKIPVIYMDRQKQYEFPYRRNPKFNVSRKNLPDYCIIFDKWINRFNICYNLNLYSLEKVNRTLFTYKKEDNKLFKEKGIHTVDAIINECLSYTNKLKKQREEIENEQEQNEKIKKVLIEKYLNNKVQN